MRCLSIIKDSESYFTVILILAFLPLKVLTTIVALPLLIALIFQVEDTVANFLFVLEYLILLIAVLFGQFHL